MSSADLGFLAIAVLVSALFIALGALSNRFFRDKIFASLTPGLVPAPGQDAVVERVKGGREYAGTIPVAFNPPKGLPPGVVGTVVDGEAELRDITATIVDLARRGHLSVKVVDVDGHGRGVHPSTSSGPFDKLKGPGGGLKEPRDRRKDKPGRDWELSATDGGSDQLATFERQLLVSLFGKGRSAATPPIRLTRWLKSRREDVRGIRDHLYALVVKHGFYLKDPRPKRGSCWRPLAFLVLIGWCVVSLLSGFTVVKALAAALLLGSAVFASRRLRSRVPRTALGTAARIQALGFKQYLATAEAKQFNFEEAAGIFSRYLPYAIVFGVSEHWAKVFGEVVEARQQELGAGDLALVGLDALSQLAWLDVTDAGLDLMGGGFDADLFGAFDPGELIDGVSGLADSFGDFLDGLDFLDLG